MGLIELIYLNKESQIFGFNIVGVGNIVRVNKYRWALRMYT